MTGHDAVAVGDQGALPFGVISDMLDKVIPVRLSSDKWEQIRKEAIELGVGPSTLARMWILERLRQLVKA